MTQEFTLRSMVKNYADGNMWDHLDRDACTKAADEIAGLRAALQECVFLLSLCEPVPPLDPACEGQVRKLGEAVGYGALMSCASALWRTSLRNAEMPVGGEFVSGPCRASVTLALKKAHHALAGDAT